MPGGQKLKVRINWAGRGGVQLSDELLELWIKLRPTSLWHTFYVPPAAGHCVVLKTMDMVLDITRIDHLPDQAIVHAEPPQFGHTPNHIDFYRWVEGGLITCDGGTMEDALLGSRLPATLAEYLERRGV